MASNLNISDVAANAEADAVTRLLNGGYLRIYDGSQPATSNHPIDTQRLLAELRWREQNVNNQAAYRPSQRLALSPHAEA